MVKKYKYHLRTGRVIGMSDADCFACQVEQTDLIESWGQPCIVYHESHGTIVSVNYEARKYGITRKMRQWEALNKCPQLICFKTPTFEGRIDVDKYEREGDKILDIIVDFNKRNGNLIVIEKGSVDEVFYDLTKLCNKYEAEHRSYKSRELYDMNIMVEGGVRRFRLSNSNGMKYHRLTYGAVIVNQLHTEIKDKLGYDMSGGVSYNKLLAKIGSNINKPNKITIIHSKAGIARVFENLDINEANGLGGKKGQTVKSILNMEKLIQLRAFRRRRLSAIFADQFGDKFGKQLWDIARGIDKEAVVHKLMNDSVSRGRQFFNGISKEACNTEMRIFCQVLVNQLNHRKDKYGVIAKRFRAEIFYQLGYKEGIRRTFNLNPGPYEWHKIKSKIDESLIPEMMTRDGLIYGIRLTADDFQEKIEESVGSVAIGERAETTGDVDTSSDEESAFVFCIVRDTAQPITYVNSIEDIESIWNEVFYNY